MCDKCYDTGRVLCDVCHGTAEGHVDGTACRWCRGRGSVMCDCVQDKWECYDEPDDYRRMYEAIRN